MERQFIVAPALNDGIDEFSFEPVVLPTNLVIEDKVNALRLTGFRYPMMCVNPNWPCRNSATEVWLPHFPHPLSRNENLPNVLMTSKKARLFIGMRELRRTK